MAIMTFSKEVPTEYFCYDCKQFRLSYRKDKTKCGNCGSSNIKTGKMGELNKEALKATAGE